MPRLNHLTERGLETQRMLGNVLMQLIAEKPFGKISVKDITERAGIDRTTFYLHFKDKDDLFTKMQQHLMTELFEYGRTSERPYPVVTLAFEHMAQHADAYRVLLSTDGNTFFSETLQEYLVTVFTPLVEDMRQNAAAPLDLDIHMLVNYLAGAMRGTARWWLEAGMPYPPDDMARRFVQIAQGGVIAGTKG